MRLFPLLLAIALLSVCACAYDVAIKITVTQDTLAVGTNVTIVEDGVRLYEGKANASGMVQFPLEAGSYFVLLDRGGYSRHVNLLEVAKSENISYTMRQLISYASAYGQVRGPPDFAGASVAAYSGGNIVKRVAPNKDGYYLMSYLPDGDYELVFSAPGFDEKRVQKALYQPQFAEVNVALSKTAAPPAEEPRMVAPGKAELQSVIEMVLVAGSSPMAGKKVVVETPAGTIEAVTGADGIARVNAARPGSYVFRYGDLVAITVVEGKVEAPAPVQQEPEVQAPAPAAPQQQKQPGSEAAAGFMLAGFVLLAVAAAVVIFIAARMMGGKKGTGAEKPHGEAAQHEPHAEAQHGKHGHAHAHRKGK